MTEHFESTKAVKSSKPFRSRLVGKEELVGAFVKTPSVHATEIFGDAGLDFIIVDEEHAPFDRCSIDLIALAARAAGIACLVRVPSLNASSVLSSLDCGADGIVAPHISSVEDASRLASLARYSGGRGFSSQTRAARYGGATIGEHIAQSDANVVVIGMLEDAEAVEHIDDIAAVDGVDGFFLGRADLAVSLGETATDSPKVNAAVERVVESVARHGKILFCGASNAADSQVWRQRGATAIVIGTDQGLLRSAAAKAMAAVRSTNG